METVAALIGAFIAFAAFGILLKLAGALGYPPTPIAFINYLFAALISLFLLAQAPEEAGRPLLWVVGQAAGLFYVVGFFVNFRAIERAGLSVAQPVSSVAVAIPILASIVFWGERPTLLQTAALLAALVALVLLSSGHGEADAAEATAAPRSSIALILAALFVVQGMVMVAPKLVEELGLGTYRYGYLFSLFGWASIASGAHWAQNREPVSTGGLGLGLILGAANVAATFLLLAALKALPGILVYPVTSVGTMLAGAVAGMVVWSERPGRRALAGMALAVPAVLLLNL